MKGFGAQPGLFCSRSPFPGVVLAKIRVRVFKQELNR